MLLDCAGVSHGRNFLDLDLAEWSVSSRVNLSGMFHLGQAAARQMVRQGGAADHQRYLAAAPKSHVPSALPMSRRKAAAAHSTHAMALDLAAPASGSMRSRPARP